MKPQNIFYVYVYLDPRKMGKFIYGDYEFDYEPFYVGKGKGNRSQHHLWEYNLKNDNNKIKVNKINKIKKNNNEIIIIKIVENTSEEIAFSLEKNLIQLMGRIHLQTGPLTNMSDGGEGNSNREFSKLHRQRISESRKGYKHTDEWKKTHSSIMREKNHWSGKNNPMYSKEFTTVEKIKMKNISKKMWDNDELRMKCLLQRAKYKYTFINDLTNELYNNILLIGDFCKEHDLKLPNIQSKILKHKIQDNECFTFKNWKIKRIKIK